MVMSNKVSLKTMVDYNTTLCNEDYMGSCVYSQDEIENARLLEASKMTPDKFCLWLKELFKCTDHLSTEDEQRIRARLNQL